MLPQKKRQRLTIRGLLSILVLLTAVRAFFRGNYEHLFVCILTLTLFCVPMFIDRTLGIDLPCGIGNHHLLLYFLSRNFRRNQFLLYQNSLLGHHAAHPQRISNGCHRICTR